MNQTDQIQELWLQYAQEHDHEPTSARQVAEWAVAKGSLSLPVLDPMDALSSKVATAMRQQMGTHDGRRYRKNHSFYVMKDGVQKTLWGQLEFLSSQYRALSHNQRREQVVNDLCQLNTDVDVGNDMHPDEDQYVLDLNFTDDVAEREVVLELA